MALENDHLKQQVEYLRDFMFSSSGNGGWGPEDDSSIQLSVNHLQRSIKSWARDWCPKALHPRAISTAKKRFSFQALNEMVHRVSGFQEVTSALQFDPVDIVTTAILSEFIRSQILAKPFFHFQDPARLDAPESFAVKATRMFEDMQSDDPKGASIWRTQTIRSVFPDPSKRTTAQAIHERVPICPKRIAPDRIQRLYRDLSEEFLYGPWPKRLRKDEKTKKEVEQCIERLYELMVMAGNIHLCLLTQKCHFVWTHPVLYLGRPFSVRSSLFNPASALCLHSEDTSHDGKLVQIVFGTSLVAYGDSEGHHQEQSRIIVGASVYLNPKRPAPAPNMLLEPAMIGEIDAA
ncbi:uncharacterized protein J3D65DRAFT_620394 [Phyllosticta citribraziliensis]|uniref:Uncharacterized protein n=1 Tax=Phyllosticta citribraziliensis TaxID=989973 RepID=A0ABR1LZA5_9PEZI